MHDRFILFMVENPWYGYDCRSFAPCIESEEIEVKIKPDGTKAKYSVYRTIQNSKCTCGFVIGLLVCFQMEWLEAFVTRFPLRCLEHGEEGPPPRESVSHHEGLCHSKEGVALVFCVQSLSILADNP